MAVERRDLYAQRIINMKESSQLRIFSTHNPPAVAEYSYEYEGFTSSIHHAVSIFAK
jgi:hypothetical protein